VGTFGGLAAARLVNSLYLSAAAGGRYADEVGGATPPVVDDGLGGADPAAALAGAGALAALAARRYAPGAALVVDGLEFSSAGPDDVGPGSLAAGLAALHATRAGADARRATARDVTGVDVVRISPSDDGAGGGADGGDADGGAGAPRPAPGRAHHRVVVSWSLLRAPGPGGTGAAYHRGSVAAHFTDLLVVDAPASGAAAEGAPAADAGPWTGGGAGGRAADDAAWGSCRIVFHEATRLGRRYV